MSRAVKLYFANLGEITSREDLFKSIRSLRDLCKAITKSYTPVYFYFSPYEMLTAFCTAEYTSTSAMDVLRVTQLMRADHLWTHQKRPQGADTELLP